MIAAAEFVAAARRYVGAPWRHGGRTASGMDCAGLLLAATADCGLRRPETVTYAALPDLALFEVLLPDYCVREREVSLGSVVRLSIAGRAQHLGIVGQHPAGGWSLIHAYMTVGCVAEHGFNAQWARRIVSVWRVREVAG